MSIEVQNVRRLRVYTETSAEFATDHTTSLSDFNDVPFIEGSIQAELTQNMLNPELGQQHIDGHPEQVLGTKACTLAFSMNLAPTGTAAVSGTTQVQSPLGQILEAVMGGEDLATGDAVDSANGPADYNLGSASGFSTGGAAGFTSGANSAYELREIEQVGGGGANLELKLDLSNTASTNDVAHGCATYFLSQDPQKSLQFVLEGEETDDRWVLMGMQLDSLSLELPVGELPRITFNLKGADWDHESDANGSFSSALGDATYSDTTVINTEGEFRVVTVGTETLSSAPSVDVPQVSFEPNLQYGPVTSPDGTNKIVRWRRTKNAPVLSGSFTTYYEDTTWFDARDNQTKKAIFYQIGNVAGESILLSVPTTQITDVQRTDSDGIAAQQVSWVARLDEGTSNNADTDEGYSPFRIHFG